VTTPTHTILAEATTVAAVSPWAATLVDGERFGGVQALVERCIR
jgi:hypothetical protein